MIIRSDIEIFETDAFSRAVDQNICRDPIEVALDKRIENAALVASQIKYLARAKYKLPSYYAARCILPPIAFEQSSNEQVAANKQYSGSLCVDLTCGLGVDSFYLSKRFDRVISLEPDPILAAIARINFARLGVSNIEVVETTAQDFIAAGHLPDADLIYADPDRRGKNGEKLVRLEDCSPNMIALYPMLSSKSPRVVMKCSPMFDINEAFRLFGTNVKTEIVSLAGENKEVLIEVSDDITVPTVIARAIGRRSVCYPYDRAKADAMNITFDQIASAQYLVIPDAALQKARVAVDYYRSSGLAISDNNGFAYAWHEVPQGIIGRVAQIDRVERFHAGALKKMFRGEGVKRVDILKRNFPIDTATLSRQLGVTQGGKVSIAFTVENGEKIAMLVTFSKFVGIEIGV